jgi:hypothetical protein
MAVRPNSILITTEGNGANIDTLVEDSQTVKNTADGTVNNAVVHTPRSLACYEHSDGTTGVVRVKGNQGLPTRPEDITATFSNGQDTVGTTSATLGSVASLTSGVVLKALTTNAGVIYLNKGGAATTANGFPLAAGQEISWPCANKNEIYAIASQASQGLAYLAW